MTRGERGRRVRWASGVASLALAGLACCTSCLYARVLYFNVPSLAAPSHFASRTVRASSRPLALRTAPREPSLTIGGERRARFGTLDALLAATRTRAFLVLLDDAIVYERYSGGVEPRTRLPCFSLSKTLAALLVGCAVDDGLLASTAQPLVEIVPELAGRPGYAEVTVEHLLRMSSGIDFSEASMAGAALYYTTDLRSQLYAYDVRWRPGTRYVYGGLGIQLLWDVLDRRLKARQAEAPRDGAPPPRTVSEYFEQRVWGPLGAESDATWSLDSEESGIEKLFGGFNATARDYARLGLLFVHGGVAGGRRVVSHDWVVRSREPDPIAGTLQTSEGAVRRGKYQWFLTMDGCCYFAKGYEGQYVFVYAAKDLVFVRFGEEYGGVDWPTLFEELAQQL